jgi:hypothetical protein
MGLPRLITTDQGREFNNLLNKEFMKKLNIKHNVATPYHPQVTVLLQLMYWQCSLLFVSSQTD